MTKVKPKSTEVNPVIEPQVPECVVNALIDQISDHEHPEHLKSKLYKLIQGGYDQNTINLMELILSEDEEGETVSPGKVYGEFNKTNCRKYQADQRKKRIANINFAKLLSPKSIDLNSFFDYRNGIAGIIKSLTAAVDEYGFKNSCPADAFLLSNLRDTLILEYYGQEAFNLFESLTMKYHGQQ